MRLLVLFLFVALMSVHAEGIAQKVTIKGKDLGFETIFTAIEKQTGYVVLANKKLFANTAKINLDVQEMPLKEFLNLIFKDQTVWYSIEDKTIFLSFTKPQQAATSHPEISIDTTIKVKVIDSTGNPLAGASVLTKNGKLYSLTNAAGITTINATAGDVLSVTFVGYEPRKIHVTASMANEANLSVVLQRIVTKLDEVEVSVNTGYQRISKERATGSYNIINREQLEKPSTNIGQRLIGTTAGLQTTMDVDGGTTFQIRGMSSLNNALVQPLIVVDGFPINGDISTLNPNDVESISILKDAAAASIWGARSANGVIVITSKRGRKGDGLKIDFNTFYKYAPKQDLSYINPNASSAETIEYEQAAFSTGFFGSTRTSPKADGNASNNLVGAYSTAMQYMNENRLGYISDAALNAKLDQLKKQNNSQQIKDLLYRNPFTQQYNLNVSGATNRSVYGFSLM